MSEAIATAAEQLVGVPFLHQGRDPLVGLDCVGVVYVACRSAGFNVADFRQYDIVPSPGQLTAELGKRFRNIAADDLTRGDIVLLGGRGSARHVGVCIGDDMMVEVRHGRKAARSRFLRSNVAGAYRVRIR